MSEKSINRKYLIAIIVFVMVLFAAGIAAGRYFFAPDEKTSEEPQPVGQQETFQEKIPITTEYIIRDSLIEYATFNAAVEPESTYYIFPQLSDEVDEIHVENGNIVKEDQLLFTLKGNEIKQQRQQATAALEQAEAQLQRIKKGAREQEIEQSKQMIEQTRASLEGAEKAYQLIKEEREEMVSQRQQLMNARSQVDNARSQRDMAINQVEQAELSAEELESNYERLLYLYEQGAIPEQQFEEIEFQKQRVQQQLKAAELQLQQAEHNLETAKEGLKLAQEYYDNPRDLEQQLANAHSQVEMAGANFESAKAQHELLLEGAPEEEIKAAEAQVRQAQASLEMAHSQEDRLQVTSPAQGIISRLDIEEGTLVSPQAATPPVVIISETMQINLTVNENTVVNLTEGMEVEVDIPVVNENVIGEIIHVAMSRDLERGGFPVEIAVDLPREKIRAGIYASVRLPEQSVDNALLIPREAVFQEGMNYYVFLLDRNGERVIRTQIETGMSTDEYFEIVDGIEKTGEVVIRGQNMLQDGDYVEVISGEDF